MRFPKLHLRDLFWLVLVCAMGCGWWVEHQKRVTERTTLEDKAAEAVKRGDDLAYRLFRLAVAGQGNEWKQGERGIIDEQGRPGP